METTLDGTVRAVDERFDVYFERHFDAPPEELVEGGNVVIRIHPAAPATVYGKVVRVEPLKMLELTWDVPAWQNVPDFFGMHERYAELIGPVH
jgi:hypothetical protein